MNHRAWLFVSVCASSIGCKSADEGAASLDQWLGESTHLAVVGSYEGTEFNARLEGEAASSVYCHRFYTPLPGTEPDAEGNYDTSQVYFAFKELGGVIDVEGEQKEFTVAYWRHDEPAGTNMEVIPRVFGSAIPEGATWSDINVFNPGADVLSGIESAAAGGTVSIQLNTGELDPGGVMMTGGRTGEYVSITWGPDDFLKVSATADCLTLPIATWPQSRILP